MTSSSGRFPLWQPGYSAAKLGNNALCKATAHYLAEHGAVFMLGARCQDRLRTTADEIETASGKALVDKTVATYGKIDVMLNNAGLMQQSPFRKESQ